MYNRYDGNTGRFVRMPEPEMPERSALRRPPPPQPRREELAAHHEEPPRHREDEHRRHEERSQRRNESGPPPARRDGPYAPRRRAPEPAREPGGLLPRGITDALSGLLRGGLETEDLLLMLILYLMYRESGDKELLIVLGAMLLL